MYGAEVTVYPKMQFNERITALNVKDQRGDVSRLKDGTGARRLMQLTN